MLTPGANPKGNHLASGNEGVLSLGYSRGRGEKPRPHAPTGHGWVYSDAHGNTGHREGAWNATRVLSHNDQKTHGLENEDSKSHLITYVGWSIC